MFRSAMDLRQGIKTKQYRIKQSSQIVHITRQLCINVADLVVSGISLVGFPDEDPLRVETCKDVQCDIIISR